MASNRVSVEASYSVAKESLSIVVTSELRPKGKDGSTLESKAASGFGLKQQELKHSPQNSSQTDGCLNVHPPQIFKTNNTWGYILIIPCLHISQPPGITSCAYDQVKKALWVLTCFY